MPVMPPLVITSSIRNSRRVGGMMPLAGGGPFHGTPSCVVRIAVMVVSVIATSSAHS